MHRFTLLGLVSLPILSVLGCSDSATSTGATGGGSGSSVGGTTSIGNGSTVGGATNAGVTMTGGVQNSGGAGGTGDTVGNGGQTASSSSVATQATGGQSTTGGSVSTGGTKASGGTTSVSTGGTKASGGTSSVSTGGTKASGGTSSASTGGTKASGGTTSTGGTKASGGTSAGTTVIGAAHTGEITFYDDNGNGTCMFGVTGETDVAALAIGSWSTAAWCGACADVTGPKGTVRVKVVNQCPSCGGAWDLDLNKSAFLKIQAESVGRYSVTWNFVACGITSAVKYRFKEGSSPGWTGVLVSNTNLPITKLEWSTDQTTWHATQRQDYNYFQDAAGFGQNPVYVRITAIDGQQLIDQLPVVQAALVVTGSANFD